MEEIIEFLDRIPDFKIYGCGGNFQGSGKYMLYFLDVTSLEREYVGTRPIIRMAGDGGSHPSIQDRCIKELVEVGFRVDNKKGIYYDLPSDVRVRLMRGGGGGYIIIRGNEVEVGGRSADYGPPKKGQEADIMHVLEKVFTEKKKIIDIPR